MYWEISLNSTEVQQTLSFSVLSSVSFECLCNFKFSLRLSHQIEGTILHNFATLQRLFIGFQQKPIWNHFFILTKKQEISYGNLVLLKVAKPFLFASR